MAAALNTTATTLEAQALEVLNAIDAAERAYNTANPNSAVQRVSISLDPENRVISASVQFVATIGGTAGTISMTPEVYLP